LVEQQKVDIARGNRKEGSD